MSFFEFLKYLFISDLEKLLISGNSIVFRYFLEVIVFDFQNWLVVSRKMYVRVKVR